MKVMIPLMGEPDHVFGELVSLPPDGIYEYVLCNDVASRLLSVKDAMLRTEGTSFILTICSHKMVGKGWRKGRVRAVRVNGMRQSWEMEYYDTQTHEWEGMFDALDYLMQAIFTREIDRLSDEQKCSDPWSVWVKLEKVSE